MWLSLAAPLAAADVVLDGELGRWLDDGVAASLGQTLSRHPRFRGQTVRLATVTPDRPPGQSHALAEAVLGRLRQRLLQVDGVRLALAEPVRGCVAPQPVDYLLRIDVEAVGRRSARVRIAMVDLAESVWVSGISYEWQGRLGSAEIAALAEPVSRAAPGSAASPIPLDRPGDVAAALKADLRCLLPRGLDGALFVETPAAGALAPVGLALTSELLFEPLAAVTRDPAAANWHLTLDSVEGSADIREVSAVLADPAGGHRQTVASVWVSGRIAVAEAPADAPRALLSALSLLPATASAAGDGICDARAARNRSCAEVGFELMEPAYLFVVATSGHAVADVPCERRLQRAVAGTHRYRLVVPPGHFATDAASAPDAGFYVLVVRERRVASRLREALAAAPDQCGNGGAAPADWLAGLQSVLNAAGDAVEWRALHVAHERGGIVSLQARR